jgi:aminomethyltransferase
MVDRGIARHGYPVYLAEGDDDPAGECTSGTQSPTIGKALGMAYLPIDATAEGTEFFVQIRNRRATAKVVPLPFYSRKKS